MCKYEPNTSSAFFSTTSSLLNDNFSPILAVLAIIKSSIVPSKVFTFKASSKVLASLSKI